MLSALRGFCSQLLPDTTTQLLFFPSVQMLVFLPTCYPGLVRQLNPGLAGNVSLDVWFCYLTVPPIFMKVFVEIQRL